MKRLLLLLLFTFSLPVFSQKLNVEFLETQKKEGDKAGDFYTAKITLSKESPKEVRVSYKTSDAQAVAGEDYEATSGELSFAPGETLQVVQIYTIPDEKPEEYLKQFDFFLENPVNATLGKRSADILTILEDDAEVTLGDGVEVIEGDEGETMTVRFPVTLTYEFGETLAIGYETLEGEGSATGGEDYLVDYSTTGFQPFEKEKMIEVSVVGDGEIEANENFFVEIWSNNENVSIRNQKSDVYIVDDDGDLYFSYNIDAKQSYQGELTKRGQASGQLKLNKEQGPNDNTFFRAWWTPFTQNTFDKEMDLKDQTGRSRVDLKSSDGRFSADTTVAEWSVDGPKCLFSPGGGMQVPMTCPWSLVLFEGHGDAYTGAFFKIQNWEEVNSSGENSVTVMKKRIRYHQNDQKLSATYKIIRK